MIPRLDLSKYNITKSSKKEEMSKKREYLPTPPTSPEEEESKSTLKRKLLHDQSNEEKDEQTRQSKKRPLHLDLSLLDLYLSSGKSLTVKDEQYGLNLLCWACQCKSIEALVKILQQLGDIDVNERQGPYLLTALHIASKLNFIEGIECLIQQPNLDLNQQDSFGMTALHYTVRSNFYQATKLLLDAGTRLDKLDKQGKLPIHHAIRNASPDLIQMILGTRHNNNNPTSTNMIWFTTPCPIQEVIIMTGNHMILKELLDAGALTHWWEDKYEAKRDELLGLCVYWNRMACFSCLIEDTLFKSQLKPSWCERALELAVQQRKIDFVIRICQEVHPCLSPHHHGHNAPLLYAVNHGFMDMIPYLLFPETSSACIQQAILFSRLIGKETIFLDLLKKHYYINTTTTSDIIYFE